MNFDEETLLEIEDQIEALDESVGLSPETVIDVKKAISRQRKKVKNNVVLDSFSERLHSSKVIERCKIKFEALKRKNYQWQSFYTGWLEGSADMYGVFKNNVR